MAKSNFETATSSSGSGSGSGDAVVEPYNELYNEKPAESDNVARRIWDSFRRNPDLHITQKGHVGADGQVFDIESAAQRTAESPLARKLKGRHLQMIAIGGSIGRSFVGIPIRRMR